MLRPCLACCLLLVVVGLSAQTVTPPDPAPRVWTIALQDGQASLIPLVRAIYQELGMTVRFEALPGERALVEANLGRADGEMGRIPGALAPYPNLVATHENLLSIDLEAWVAPDSALWIKAPSDLTSLRLGGVIGSKITHQFLSQSGLAAIEVGSHESLAKLLLAGRIDVALISTASQDSEVRRKGRLASASLLSSPTYHVLNRSHADLIPRFDEALRALKRDGRYQKLLLPATVLP